ncbi:MAG TPA: D-alanine--D-alanine ligase family protein [Candidatus Dormibacteraeota bacterium]
MSLKGLTVGVVFGSRSVEHEISVITACQVMPLLRGLGASVVPLYITKQGRWLTGPGLTDLGSFRESLPEDGDAVELDLDQGRLRTPATRWGRPRDLGVEVIFPILHGTFGEDGSLAGLAAMARLPQVGSDVLSSALAMDKLRAKAVFLDAGLPVVPGRGARSAADAAEVAEGLGYPVVVKPNRGGSSIGVGLAADPSELEQAAGQALELDTWILIEPAVPGAADLNCAVKRGAPRCSEVERPVKSSGLLSYADKYSGPAKTLGEGAGKAAPGAKAGTGDGRRQLPADIPASIRAEVQRLALAAFDALGCAGTARVDFLLASSGEVFLNEVNTIPGSLAFYLWEASGIPFAQLIEELVKEALGVPDPRLLSLPGNLLAAGAPLAKATPPVERP